MVVTIACRFLEFIHFQSVLEIGLKLFLLIICSTPSLSAQDFVHEEIYQELINIATQQDSFHLRKPLPSSIAEFKRLLALNFSPKNATKKDWFYQQNKILQKPNGLRWTNMATVRDNYEIDQESDRALNGVYLRTGVEYNLLEEGLMGNYQKRKVLEKEYLIFELEETLQQRQNDYPYLYNLILQIFNRQKIAVLRNRIQVLEKIVEVIYQLYYGHVLPYADLNLYKGKLDESRMLLAAFEAFNRNSSSIVDSVTSAQFAAEKLPLFELDLQKLLKDDTYANDVLKRNQLKKEVLDLSQQQKINQKLRVFGHLNYRSSNVGGRNRFWSFGTSFSTPIDFSKKEKEQLLLLEKEQLDWENIYLFDNLATQMVNLHHEYKYKLRTYVRFLYKLENLKEKERIEKVLLADKESPHSPLRLIEVQEEKVAVEIELIDLKQHLYLILLQIYTRSNHPAFTICLNNIDFNHIGKKLLGERFFLLDTEVYPIAEVDFLSAFLQKNELTNILLAGPKATFGRWKEQLGEKYFDFFIPKNDLEKQQVSSQGVYFSDADKKFVWVKRDPFSNNWFKLVYVPTDTFTARADLENWINKEMEQTHHTRFVFTNFNLLKQLDEQTINDLTNN